MTEHECENITEEECKVKAKDKKSVKALQYTCAAIFLYLAFYAIQRDRSDILVLAFAIMAGVSFSPAVAMLIDSFLLNGARVLPWGKDRE